MISNPARTADPRQGDEAETRILRNYANAPVKFKKQISDQKRLLAHIWNGRLPGASKADPRLPDTQAAHQHASLMLDLLAVYDDGADRIDRFLEEYTCFDKLTRSRLKERALASPREGYSPAALGRLMGLTWAVRRLLKLTNIEAIDTPASDVLAAQRKADDKAYQRQKRAKNKLRPKPLSAAKRKAAELLKRRMTLIYDALPFGKELTISELSAKLASRRNSPFQNVSRETLPDVIRCLVKADTVGLFTDIRPFRERPDLKPHMFVSRRPRNEAEYRNHFTASLARFGPRDAARIEGWFFSRVEKEFREICGFNPRDPALMKAAVARRNELVGKRSGAV